MGLIVAFKDCSGWFYSKSTKIGSASLYWHGLGSPKMRQIRGQKKVGGYNRYLTMSISLIYRFFFYTANNIWDEDASAVCLFFEFFLDCLTAVLISYVISFYFNPDFYVSRIKKKNIAPQKWKYILKML